MKKEEISFEKCLEIQNGGCPYCGNPEVDIIVSACDNVEPHLRCPEKGCPSEGREIPVSEVQGLRLPQPYDSLLTEKFRLGKRIKEVRGSYNLLQDMIRDCKRDVCKKCSDYCLVCKKKYDEVKNLQLFDKEGNRLYNRVKPYVMVDPKHERLLAIWSVNSKRRVKALLSSRWFVAREDLNEANNTLQRLRQSAQKMKIELSQLTAKMNKLAENDEFMNVMASRETKGNGK